MTQATFDRILRASQWAVTVIGGGVILMLGSLVGLCLERREYLAAALVAGMAVLVLLELKYIVWRNEARRTGKAPMPRPRYWRFEAWRREQAELVRIRLRWPNYMTQWPAAIRLSTFPSEPE